MYSLFVLLSKPVLSLSSIEGWACPVRFIGGYNFKILSATGSGSRYSLFGWLRVPQPPKRAQTNASIPHAGFVIKLIVRL